MSVFCCDKLNSIPSKSLLKIKLTTPATASEPYIEAAPSFKISTLSVAIIGIIFVSTNTAPSLDVPAAIVCLRPSTNTNVDERPRPLRFTLDVP